MNNNQRPTGRSGNNQGSYPPQSPRARSNGQANYPPAQASGRPNQPGYPPSTNRPPQNGYRTQYGQTTQTQQTRTGQTSTYNVANGANPNRQGSARPSSQYTGTHQVNQPRGTTRPPSAGAGAANQTRTQPRVQPKAQPKKVQLTPEQKEKARRDRQRERHQLGKTFVSAIKTFLVRLLVFIMLFILLGAAVVGAFYLNLTKTDSKSSSGYSYSIGEESYTLAYSEAVRDGRVFVNFSDIALYCNFASTGSLDDIKYVVKGDETETIRFVVGTHTVYVNEIETRLSAESFLSGTELFVPIDFVEAYLKGITVDINERTHKISIKRDVVESFDENGNKLEFTDPELQPISFLLASPAPMAGIDESVAHELVPAPDMNFITNLSAYEEYMNPGNTNEYIILVNRTNLLDSTYVPGDLMGIENTRKDGRDRQMMRTYPAKALEALFLEMAAAGFTDVDVTSAYRSYSYQEYLFGQRLQMMSHLGDKAYEAAAEVVMPAGSSEHQSGLCVDMHNIATGADVSFGETEQFKWLKENCWKFGFILRYPEDKVSVTKISYEPWHYRYVGRYHAQRMYEMGLSLEEYHAHLGLTSAN